MSADLSRPFAALDVSTGRSANRPSSNEDEEDDREMASVLKKYNNNIPASAFPIPEWKTLLSAATMDLLPVERDFQPRYKNVSTKRFLDLRQAGKDCRAILTTALSGCDDLISGTDRRGLNEATRQFISTIGEIFDEHFEASDLPDSLGSDGEGSAVSNTADMSRGFSQWLEDENRAIYEALMEARAKASWATLIYDHQIHPEGGKSADLMLEIAQTIPGFDDDPAQDENVGPLIEQLDALTEKVSRAYESLALGHPALTMDRQNLTDMVDTLRSSYVLHAGSWGASAARIEKCTTKFDELKERLGKHLGSVKSGD